MKQTVGMVTGSFDPFTKGHLDLVVRAANMFDHVYVAMLVNPDKQYMFDLQERMAMIRRALLGIPNVTPVHYEGMTVDLAHQLSVDCLVRGIRNVADYAYEKDMAAFNMREGGVDTVCLMCNDQFDVCSAAVRAGLQVGEPVDDLLPDGVGALATAYWQAKQG